MALSMIKLLKYIVFQGMVLHMLSSGIRIRKKRRITLSKSDWNSILTRAGSVSIHFSSSTVT
jgi:hypothetical protein